MCEFQIRNVDKEGCGSFYYITLPDNATKKQIEDAIANFLTEKKYHSERPAVKYNKYFGWNPLFKNRKMKVVEFDNITKKAKRNGRKGYAQLQTTKVKGKNILTSKKFEHEYHAFYVELFDDRRQKA